MKSNVMRTLPFAAVLTIAPVLAQAPAPKSPDQAKGNLKATEAVPTPTEKEIVDAAAKGMVWVNTTMVSHKDGQYFKIKRGKFMTVDDAKKAGYGAAQESTAEISKSTVKK